MAGEHPDQQRLDRLRERLARDSELIRRNKVLIAAADRAGYARGWHEGLVAGEARSEVARRALLTRCTILEAQLVQAERELAAAQSAIAREPTQALPAMPDIEILRPAGRPKRLKPPGPTSANPEA